MDFLLLIRYSFAPLVIILTLFGSTIGLVVFTRPGLKKIGPVNIYRFMFAIEYLNAVLISEYVRDILNFEIACLSSFICKLNWIVNVVYLPIPAMLLVFISMDRYISIAYPSKRLVLRKNSIQLIYFMGLIGYNLCVYLFIVFYADVMTIPTEEEASNSTGVEILTCDIENHKVKLASAYVDLVNRVLLPFLLMVMLTILLIRKIHLSRKKFALKNKLLTKQRTLNRDLKFSIYMTSMNLVYLSFNLPFAIYLTVLGESSLIYLLLEYVNFFYYSIDFFIILATNSFVRKEFFGIFCKKVFIS